MRSPPALPRFPRAAATSYCLRTFGRAPLQLNFVRARLIGQLPNLDAAVPDIGKLARELQVCQRCVVWGVWGHLSAASQVGQPAGWTPQTVGHHCMCVSCATHAVPTVMPVGCP